MGVGLAIGATLLGGWMQGRAQQQAAEAQARQAEANAQIAYNNSQKQQEQAEVQAQNNAMNEENKRRKIRAQQAAQRANIGAAGISATGSAMDVLADSYYNQEMDLAIDRYNGRQKVDNMLQASTDSLNQGDVYSKNAKDYRKAGKRAMMNSMLQAGLTVATGLYSPGSTGASKAAATSSGPTWGSQYYNHGLLSGSSTVKSFDIGTKTFKILPYGANYRNKALGKYTF